MQVLLTQNRTTELTAPRNNREFGTKIGIIGKLFGCWHKNLSRPFSSEKSSYRTCLHCGARKHFDADNLKTFGPFYYPPVARTEMTAIRYKGVHAV